jgi:hypothetical protein
LQRQNPGFDIMNDSLPSQLAKSLAAKHETFCQQREIFGAGYANSEHTSLDATRPVKQATRTRPQIRIDDVFDYPTLTQALERLQQDSCNKRVFVKYAELIEDATKAKNVGELLILIYDKYDQQSGQEKHSFGELLINHIKDNCFHTAPGLLTATLIIRACEQEALEFEQAFIEED